MRLVSHALISIAALTLTGPVLAQFIPPPVINTPTPVAPYNPVEYEYGGLGQIFEWYQSPAIPTPQIRLPQHFILCVRAAGDPPCSHATALSNKLPGQIPNNIRRNAQGSVIGISYFDKVPLPDRLLDQWVEWQVAGCTGPADTSCKFAPSTWMVASTMEVQADSITYLSTPGTDEVTFSGVARNNGTRTTRQFHSLIESWQALIDPRNGRCLKDPNRAVGNNLRLMYKNGQSVRVTDLPRDSTTGEFVVDLTKVAAITESLGAWAITPTMNPATILPRTVVAPDRNWGPVVGNKFNVPGASRPIAFVTRLAVDSNGAIWEANEFDNMLAECKVVT